MNNNKFTRGVANCNPANIRHGSRWIGLAVEQNDKQFCTFKDMVFGVRALLVLLRTYKYKYDCVTLREVINKFAPPCENNTYGYMIYVRDYLRGYRDSKGFEIEVDFDMVINKWFNRQSPSAYIFPLCKAICMIESRYDLTEVMFNRALELI